MGSATGWYYESCSCACTQYFLLMYAGVSSQALASLQARMWALKMS